MKRRDFIKTMAAGMAAAAVVPGQGCKSVGSVPLISGAGGVSASGGKRKIITNYRDRDWADLFPPTVTDIDPEGITLLLGDVAELNGGMSEPWGFRCSPQGYVDGWTTPNGLSISWTVNAPKAMDCSLAMIYSCAANSAGSEYEILRETAGYVGYDYNGRKTEEKLKAVTRKTAGWWPDQSANWSNFDREELTGTLHIPAGLSVITIRATSMPEKAKAVMVFRSLELIPKCAEASIAAAKQRALQMRGDRKWFVDAKYGLMFHYTTTCYPRRGPRKPFNQAVRDFNVERFADMVKETGAGYVFFFVSHGVYWFPAPLKTVEEILPGRTCDRDLIGDLADALGRRGIKLMLYYNPSHNDDIDWRIAAGWGPVLHRHSAKEMGAPVNWDKTAFYTNQCRILEEVGKRYGRSVAGYWFDNGYPFQLFEKQAIACKVGNPDRLIGYNSWLYPKITDFQDFYAAEWGCSAVRPPDDYFDEGHAQGGLQPHGTIFIDGAWHNFTRDTDITPQRFSTNGLIGFTKTCAKKNIVLTINMCIYQDGTVCDTTLEKMKNLRKAIHGA